MTQAGAGKTKGRKAKAASTPSKGGSAEPSFDANSQARIKALEAELASVQQRLAEAQAQIRELEESRELVRNRIDWVIDSLNDMIQK